MFVLSEDTERVGIELSPTELVGIANALNVCLMFHETELHTLTAMWDDEMRALQQELLPVIDRLRTRRLTRGLPW